MKSAVVLGPLRSSSNLDLTSSLGFLTEHKIGKIFIGGYSGTVKEFALLCKEQKIDPTLILTKKGQSGGYGSKGEINEIATKGYFEKKELLLSSSETFLFLPTERIGLGLMSEIMDLLDYSLVYCELVKQQPPTLAFTDNIYKDFISKALPDSQNLPNLSYV